MEAPLAFDGGELAGAAASWPAVALAPASQTDWVLAAGGAAIAWVSALALSVIARRLGLEDRGGDAELHRATFARPKALVAGLALALGLAVYFLADEPDRLGSASLAALALAAGVGLLDDLLRDGFGARAKFALQLLPGAAFAFAVSRGEGAFLDGFAGLPCGADHGDTLAIGLGIGLAGAALLAALAAQNLANTWDNADGVLLSSAVLALALARPPWALVLAPLLLVNLRPRGEARVLLGDSGSHLLAILLLLEPRAWGVFLVPALDLARVSRLRAREGRPWWRGDRAHLAHRLQARGLGPVAVAAVLCGAGAPAIACGALCADPLARLAGVVASSAAFLVLLRISPEVDARGGPRETARGEARAGER